MTGPQFYLPYDTLVKNNDSNSVLLNKKTYSSLNQIIGPIFLQFSTTENLTMTEGGEFFPMDRKRT